MIYLGSGIHQQLGLRKGLYSIPYEVENSTKVERMEVLLTDWHNLDDIIKQIDRKTMYFDKLRMDIMVEEDVFDLCFKSDEDNNKTGF